MKEPEKLLHKLKMLTGVVEVGLFCGMARAAYFGNEDGSVTVRTSLRDHLLRRFSNFFSIDAMERWENRNHQKSSEYPELRRPLIWTGLNRSALSSYR
jgi:hypothetical protein